MALVFSLLCLLCGFGVLKWLGSEFSSVARVLEGDEVDLSPRTRGLWAALRAADDDLDYRLASQDFLGHMRERRRLVRRLPADLGRVVLFSTAAAGLIELAVGTTKGEVRWTGVASLGLGLAAQVIFRGLGQSLNQRAETTMRSVERHCSRGPQTFGSTGP